MTLPSPEGSKKESCFSAVEPVSGWNMWVKWVAPFSSAHSFIASATASASSGSSASPPSRVACSFSKTSSGQAFALHGDGEDVGAERVVLGQGQVERAEGLPVGAPLGCGHVLLADTGHRFSVPRLRRARSAGTVVYRSES